MAGRSSKADNRGTNFLGFLVSGKGKDFHTFRSAERRLPPFEATGGTQVGPGGAGTALEPGNGYKYHFFTASGSLITAGSPSNAVSYVIVAGGACGGGRDGVRSGGGGGGAGGYVEAINQSFDSDTTYSIVIGAGGAAHTPGPGGDFRGLEGTDSTLGLPTPVVAYHGGAGGGFSQTGNPGGSGGGGGQSPTAPGRVAGLGLNPLTPAPVIASFPSYVPGTTQGEPGGDGTGYPGAGGGAGGGAGAAGAPDAGGDGKAAFSGDTGIPPSYGTPGPTAGRWFAGGGGGQGYSTGSNEDPGGAGGGAIAGSDAAANTGGGGGAQSGGTTGYQTSAGSGIVIIRYPA